MSIEAMPTWAWAIVGVVGGLLLVFALGWLANPKQLDLQDKVVVITGGSSGIGKSIAAHCLRRGAHVALLARRMGQLEEARTELLAMRAAGSSQRVTVHSADVTDAAACEDAVRAVLREHGAIHALVASAGVSDPMEFERMDADRFEHVFRVNVFGIRNVVAAALPALKESGLATPAGSRLMLVSSTAGLCGLYGFTHYSSSKFALLGFAQSLAQEVRPWNLRVGLCFPPDTETPLLASERDSAPKMTRVLSGNAATLLPDDVAAATVSDLCAGRFFSVASLETWALTHASAGLSPAPTVQEWFPQLFLASLMRLVALFVLRFQFFGPLDSHAAEIRRESDGFRASYAPPTAARPASAASSATRPATAASGAEERKNQ